MQQLESPTKFILKPFQDTIRERIIKIRRHGVALKMGRGKTVIGTKALWDIYRPGRRVLILCTQNAIRTWQDHIDVWFPGLDAQEGENSPYVIQRWRKKYNNPDARKKLWRLYDPTKMNVYITTYAGFLVDFEELNRTYDVIILDEPHRRMRKITGNRKKPNLTFEALKEVCKNCTYFWPVTGTPGRLPQHFWWSFHLMDPVQYRSYWKFIGAFCYSQSLPFGGREILGLKNKHIWDQTLKSKFSMIVDTGHEPPKRQLLYVDMDDEQERLYNQMTEEMLVQTPTGLVVAATSLSRTLRHRQILVCPKILDPAIPSYGGAIEALIDELSDSDPHVVIFTPFTDVFPYLCERLRQAGHQDVFTLSGGLTADELHRRISLYRKSRGIMVCSILYAQSFSLEPAERAFFLGYEFDPDDNEQAEYRLKRETTTYPINIYYYAYQDTYDERQCEIVNIKRQQAETTVDLHKVGIKI